MPKTQKPVPNFIYVGAPKSGSTWLFEALRQHPEIWVYPGKSTKHFETDDPGPISDYLLHFRSAGTARAIGEISHDVYLYPTAAARLHEAFPDMKIIICLREPGDFARSVLKWLQAHTGDYGKTTAEITAHERYENLLAFGRNVARFYKLYPKSNMLVLFFEDLNRDPERFLWQVLHFLGVDPMYRPTILGTVVNPARPARSKSLNQSLFRMGVILRTLGGGAVVEKLKSMAIVESILYRHPHDYDDADPEIVAAVAAARVAAKLDFDALETMIGRPLPTEWRQRTAP